MTEDDLIKESGFTYLESKGGDNVLILLHGLFGALSNFRFIVEGFKSSYNVVIPMLPIMEMPMKQLGIKGLVSYVESFIDHKGYETVNVLGNSLGGHIGQLYALKRPEKINSLILTGSSGLFESAMGKTFPKRGDYDFIKKKSESTFFDPKTATKELVDEVYDIVNDRSKGIRIVITAKSAVRNNLADEIHQITAPTLLVWGNQDNVTPPFVAEKFHELLPDSQLEFIDKCGHAPMMERPQEFNEILTNFLERVSSSPRVY
ncbi:MAG: alpha/beta hydrolase [Saprospiraceae bacterium]|nr:alpha/beta hydrolase [Saprospiraceae bacterium]